MRLKVWCVIAAVALSSATVGAADIRFATKGLPPSLGNPYQGNGSPGVFLWSAMFDGLTRLDKNGAISPALATRWTMLSPTAWQFSLRRGVVFSNGEAFNAKAVIATIDWLRTPEGSRTVIGNEIRNVVAVEATDDNTVVIHTERPDAILPARLSGMTIVAPSAWHELGPDGFAQSPAGTGPFAVKDWGANAKVTLVAHPDSWRKPKADRLILINLPDNASRVQALLSGQVEIAGNIGIDDIDVIENAGMLTAVGPAMSAMSIAFRQEGALNPAMKDVRVRQALNYAVDKVALDRILLHNLGPASGQPAARGVTGYDPDIAPYPYDPAKAKALLAEAGYGDGFPLRFVVMVDRSPADRAVFESMAQSLAKVGVQVELRTVTLSNWMEAYLSGNWGRDVDGFLLSFNAAASNDVARPMEIYSCLRPNGFMCDKTLADKLVASNEEMDPNKRIADLNELAQLYHDAAPALYLNDMFDVFGVSRKIEGFTMANRAPVYENISVKK